MLSLAASLKRFKPGVKLVYDSHEYFAGWPVYRDVKGSLNKAKAFLVWKWLLINEKKVAAQADAVLCTTGFIQKRLEKRFGTKPIYSFIRNIPEFEIPIRNNYLRKQFGIGPEKTILVHSGNIYLSDKDFSELVNKLDPKGNLALVFIAKSASICHYSKLIDENQKSCVFFHEYVLGKKLGHLLASAEIGIVFVKESWASHYLTSPNRLMEYIISGIPFISNQNEEAKYLSSNFSCGLVLDSFFEDWAEAVKTISEHFSEYKSACNRARLEFSWDIEKTKLLDLYKKIT